ncbi:MAG: polymerase sigma-70 factor [Acidimicrobiales bacterium]|nr:polymerase sigma-70 factor [Acidimicrobiales bacterium]
MASTDRYRASVLPPPDVAALAERAQTGDDDAWEHLYRLAYPRLLAYARRRLAGDAAVEAVSETMVRAVSGVDRFVWQGAGFEGWLFGILRHVVLDAQRSAGRAPTMADADRALLTRPSDEPGPLDHVLGDEEARAVRAAFERLAPADQELLELRVVAGLSADEVGRVLGKRPGAIRMAQNRALGRLRGLLDGAS